MKVFKKLNENIVGARILFAQAYMYFREQMYRIQMVEDPQIAGPAMCVDKYWRLYYNSEWLDKHNSKENTFSIYHELCHLIYKHAERQGDRIHKVWNWACDLEINSGRLNEINNWRTYEKTFAGTGRDPIVCPLEIPDGLLLPSQFGFKDGLIAEEYYDLLIAEGCGESDEQGGSCGGFSGEGDPTDEDGKISPAEGEIMRRRLADQLTQGTGKLAGNLPADIARFVQATLHPQVDWKRELRAAVRNAFYKIAGRVDYTFTRASRRDIPGFILPGMEDSLPQVAVVVDTSGSMDQESLEAAMTELNGILRQYSGKFAVHFLSCDYTVNSCKKIFNIKQADLIGGGGTNMVAGIDQAAKLKPRPDITVVITDGYTPWPSVRPKAKVIVACTTDMECPEWASVVRIKVGREKR